MTITKWRVISSESEKRERRPLFQFRLVGCDQRAVPRGHWTDRLGDWTSGAVRADDISNLARFHLHQIHAGRRPHGASDPLVLIHREPLLIECVDPGALRLHDESHAARDVLEVFRGRRFAM